MKYQLVNVDGKLIDPKKVIAAYAAGPGAFEFVVGVDGWTQSFTVDEEDDGWTLDGFQDYINEAAR